MQYSEIQDKISQDKLAEICVITGKTPKEVIKQYMKIEYNSKLWNKVHPEWGNLIKIEKEPSPTSGYLLKCTWEPNKPKRGKTEMVTRSDFIHDDGETELEWRKLIGRQCLFYVTYTENKEDGSVFRILLDIEPR